MEVAFPFSPIPLRRLGAHSAPLRRARRSSRLRPALTLGRKKVRSSALVNRALGPSLRMGAFKIIERLSWQIIS